MLLKSVLKPQTPTLTVDAIHQIKIFLILGLFWQKPKKREKYKIESSKELVANVIIKF